MILAWISAWHWTSLATLPACLSSQMIIKQVATSHTRGNSMLSEERMSSRTILLGVIWGVVQQFLGFVGMTEGGRFHLVHHRKDRHLSDLPQTMMETNQYLSYSYQIKCSYIWTRTPGTLRYPVLLCDTGLSFSSINRKLKPIIFKTWNFKFVVHFFRSWSTMGRSFMNDTNREVIKLVRRHPVT